MALVEQVERINQTLIDHAVEGEVAQSKKRTDSYKTRDFSRTRCSCKTYYESSG